MSENPFGKLSRLLIRVCEKDGVTVSQDVFFTAPFKLMRPFPIEKGGLRYMQMAASAGIMEGDGDRGAGSFILLSSSADNSL